MICWNEIILDKWLEMCDNIAWHWQKDGIRRGIMEKNSKFLLAKVAGKGILVILFAISLVKLLMMLF